MKINTKTIAVNGVVAALYIALTLLCYPFSFLGIQFRFAEILVLFCFFNPKLTIGVTFGCVVANFASELGPIDALFGGLATLASCLIVSFCKHLFIAGIFPILINAFVVGAELYFILKVNFWINVGTVALGEFAVMVVGVILLTILRKRNKKFFELIGATRNLPITNKVE